MFRELKDFAVAAPVSLTIFPAGDELRVVITQKQNGSEHVPLSLAVTGTAEELDRDLPLAIAESRAIPTKSVKEQVSEQARAQASATAGGAEDDDAAGDQTPSKTQTRKPAKQKARPQRPAPRKPARTPTITPLVKPEAPKPDKKAEPKGAATPTPGSRAAEKLAAKREACLADLTTAMAKHGSQVTRAQYAALKTKTGRGYETAFGGWTQFLEAHAALQPAAAAAKPPATADQGEKASTEATDNAGAEKGGETLNPPTVDAAALNTLTQQVPVQASLLASEPVPATTDTNTVNLF